MIFGISDSITSYPRLSQELTGIITKVRRTATLWTGNSAVSGYGTHGVQLDHTPLAVPKVDARMVPKTISDS